MNRTTIEWCRTYRPDGSYEEGFTTNPVRFATNIPGLEGKQPTVTMCQKISPGCAHCYAETIVRRFWPKAAGKFPGYTAQGVASGQFVLNTAELQAILRHRKPCRLFWGDMTDLFQDGIPDEFLDQCFAVCALTPHITHIFLTKRPERRLKYLRQVSDEGDMQRWRNAADEIADVAEMAVDEQEALFAEEWPLPNVWHGVSVEDQDQADKRIPLQLQTSAAVHFISAEPLLGSIDLGRFGWLASFPYGLDIDGGDYPPPYQLDWVICGGESGRNARPMHPDWARSLRDQCQAAGVPFFFKQWGEWEPVEPYPNCSDWSKGEAIVNSYNGDIRGLESLSDDSTWLMRKSGKKAAGALLDGREWRDFPEAAR